MTIIESAGVFVYPLGLCYILAVYLILERWIALRSSRLIPVTIKNAILSSNSVNDIKVNEESVAGRIIAFCKRDEDSDARKAYARYELSRLERGMFLLDIVIAVAPLIGLLGTVVGLIQVFSNIAADTGVPDPGILVNGIALALTTTMLGLVITIPAMAGNSYLMRKIDSVAVKLEVMLERL